MITPDDVEDRANLLLALAELMRAGMLTAERDPGGDFKFKITDEGIACIEAME